MQSFVYRGMTLFKIIIPFNCFSSGNGLKGHVALNKNLAFLKFRLYEVITHPFVHPENLLPLSSTATAKKT